MKKAWKRPELIVIVKGHPGETLTTGCKVAFGNGPVGDVNPYCQTPGQENAGPECHSASGSDS